jgi:peptidoglycan/LPS O-acetylase OafA/YrhL
MLSHFLPGTHPLNTFFHFGRAGVIAFFVLSGFLITGILIRYRDRGLEAGRPGAYLPTFYLRRALRIFPAYYLLIAVVALSGYAPVSEHLGWHLSYTSNMATAASLINFADAGHLWSVCVEEQFYLLWPAVVLFTPPSRLGRAVVVLIAGGLAYKLIGSLFNMPWVATSFVLPGCLDALGLGALLALLVQKHEPNFVQRAIAPWALVGLVTLCILQFIRATAQGDVKEWPVYQTLIDMSIALPCLWVILAAVTRSSPIQTAVLSWRPLRYIGRISYGVYLNHFFLRTAMPRLSGALGVDLPPTGVSTFLLYSATAILIAAVSWHCVEYPLNRLKNSWAPVAD